MANQRTEILSYIKQFGSITRLEAMRDLGVAELSSRIGELEAQGYSFERKTESFITRLGKKSHFTRYSLKGEN